MRIVFMGTPDFAVASLDILVRNGYNIVGVITATDKWGGRGNKTLIESAVKRYAVSKGLNILQPKNLKASEFVEELRSLKADVQVVVAFRMLPVVVWDMPRLGTYNLHGSLLPKYRGAAPINWAVIRGETETGVTSFKLKHEIDTGDVVMRRPMRIYEDDTVGDVHDRMLVLGAQVVLKTIQKIESGTYDLLPQNDSEVTKAPKLKAENTKIDFNQTVDEVYNFIRGLNPYPSAWTKLQSKKLKIYWVKKENTQHEIEPGTFQSDNKTYLKVACQDGFVHLQDLQLQGKKRMNIKAFLNGWQGL